jgi:hypothetical protein
MQHPLRKGHEPKSPQTGSIEARRPGASPLRSGITEEQLRAASRVLESHLQKSQARNAGSGV